MIQQATGVPERARVELNDGPHFDAVIQSFWPAGVFVLTDHPDLRYSGGAKVIFFKDTAKTLEMPAQVATWVRGRGVRLEASPEAPELVIRALGAWTKGLAAATPEPDDAGPPLDERSQPLSGRRILVVDDDVGLLKMVQRRLRTFGCEVEITASPPEALQKVSSSQVDAVVMDWMLPEIPGRRLLGELKVLDRHLPVAVMSGQLCWDGAYDDVVGFGADAVLEKPLDVWRMVNWLHSVTRDARDFV